MKRKSYKILAFALAIVVTCCSFGLNFPASANALSENTKSEKLIGDEFSIDFADISEENLNKYFTAGKLYGAGHTETIKPSELFTTDENPTGNVNWKHQNNY